ncbi:helix-turn-helix domain-containing protein [Bradyrhizobium genosp. SA-3]|uniref:helix-turn-helix domain-containing protein n=1 Tax=Bradyrhizobium genosp. SA-3 TaxID=508868 RepID=UPI003D9B97A1
MDIRRRRIGYETFGTLHQGRGSRSHDERGEGAAKVLNVAQPALSQHIASLETDFKCKLLDRSASGSSPPRPDEFSIAMPSRRRLVMEG